MKRVTIDLADPFDEIVDKLASLPPTDNLVGSDGPAVSELSPEVKQVLRSLYEAAHGRQIATQIGLVPVAPALALFLKDVPFEVGSQTDFLLEALARLGTNLNSVTNIPSRRGDKKIGHPRAESCRSSNHQQQHMSQATR